MSLATGTRGSDLVTQSSDTRPGVGETDNDGDLSRDLDWCAEFLPFTDPSTDTGSSSDLILSLAVDISPIDPCDELELLHNSWSISLAAKKQEDNTTLCMQTKFYLKISLWIPLSLQPRFLNNWSRYWKRNHK